MRVLAKGFDRPFKQHNGSRFIPLTESSIRWASLCFGSSHCAIEDREFALHYAHHKSETISIAVDVTNSRPRRTLGYNNIDPSEKRNLSYHIGMSLSTLVADQILSIPYLVHAESCLKLKYLIRSGNGKSLADLIGWDRSGRLHVIEAKGKQNKPTPKEHQAWKAQADTIESVDKKRPATISYCCIWGKHTLAAKIHDPDPSHKYEKSQLHFAENLPELLSQYYKPFKLAIAAGGSRTGHINDEAFYYCEMPSWNKSRTLLVLHRRAFENNRSILKSSESRFPADGFTDPDRLGSYFVGRNGVGVIHGPSRFVSNFF